MELAPGVRLGPYEIVAPIGVGGMGEVYEARDTRLGRTVAIKVITQQLASDPRFRERFEREAHTVSQLNHPNICTLHDVGHQDGVDFLVMEFVRGETLAERIRRGPVPPGEALEILNQMAQALAEAHRLGIVHRDIKPANVMLTSTGFVKVLDFGLAKVDDRGDITRTGVAIGTLAYMAPEQLLAEGRLGPETDVWALGVVLYEVLSGTRPFHASSAVGLFRSIVSDTPPPIDEGRLDVPRRLKRLIGRAMEKDANLRHATAAEFGEELGRCRQAVLEPTTSARGTQVRKWLIAAACVIALIAGVVATRSIVKARRAGWARSEAIPQIQRLAERGEYVAAFALAGQAGAYLGDDPALAALWPVISVIGSWHTDPPGARVSFKEYSAVDAEWQYLGTTPIVESRLPRGTFRFMVSKDGFETVHLARALTVDSPAVHLALAAAGTLGDMVAVPGDTLPVNLSGFNTEDLVEIGPFLIDRTEVTNRAFKEFVDAGGYTRPEGWTDGAHPASFSDSTRRPGPAGWELGEYAAGQGDAPVGGVSWYEAAAYCRFRNKRLPTLYHWARAALAPHEITAPLGPSIVPLSNFSGKGPGPVGSFNSMGPYGTFDTAGNVREWSWNASTAGRRWILGGSWTDPDYMFSVPMSLPPDDRQATNGFRCMRTGEDAPIAEPLMRAVDVSSPDYRDAQPVSNETFELFAKQFAYIPSTSSAWVESRIETPTGSIRERVSVEAGYDNERLGVYVFLPKDGHPPYQAVVYFPALNAFQFRASSASFYPGDYIVKSGRALVLPVYKGSFERWDPVLGLTGEEYFRAVRQRLLQWRQDIGRSIDYLGTRGDIDMSRIAYYGRSFGASMPLPLLELEPRLRIAILQSAGFTYRKLPAEADAVNYAPRIRIPVLMMTGRHDYVFPYQTSQKPLFDSLGARASDKRHVVYDAGHDSLPRSQVVREILDWLDRYFGAPSAH